MLLFRRQCFIQAERRLPCDIAGIGIHCPEASPWWLLTRGIPNGASTRVLYWSREAVIRTRTIVRATIKRLGRAIAASIISARPLFLDPSAERRIVRLHENISCFRIRCHAAPVRPAVAGKDDSASWRCAFFMK